MTLRELCDALGVTRRAVQGYEKAGLVKSSGRTERGYLLYDKKMQVRVRTIKLYQRLGFKIMEIKKLIDAPKDEVKEALEMQVQWLEKERESIDDLIVLANEIIQSIR